MNINIVNTLIKKAMVEKDEVTKDILRLLKGEIEREKSKATDLNKEFSDDDHDNVAKKMIKNNQITLKLMIEADEENVPDKTIKVDFLLKEIEILKSLLPKAMCIEDLKLFVANNKIDISGCKSEGQAIGMIMKEAKKANINVSADTVKEFTKESKLF